MVFVVVVAMYISSGVFLLWLFAELCGAHFVVAFHCYCCRCCCLVLGFYFVFTLSTSLEFQFTLLLLFRAVTLPLCSLTHTEASKRERESGEQLTQIRNGHVHRFFYRMRESQGERERGIEWDFVHSLIALDSQSQPRLPSLHLFFYFPISLFWRTVSLRFCFCICIFFGVGAVFISAQFSFATRASPISISYCCNVANKPRKPPWGQGFRFRF